MQDVEGDEAVRVGSAGELYVAIVCALVDAPWDAAERALSWAEREVEVEARCETCAFCETCVKRALAGGRTRARAWLRRTEKQAGMRLIGG